MTIPSTMQAARFVAADRSLSLQTVSVPTPGPNEVLVKIEACGICLSDVHLIDGTLPGPLAEVTPGHEASGLVAVLGSAVTGWEVGDPVVLAGGRPCLHCPNCVTGRFERCLSFEIMGFNYDGAWADYVAVPAMTMTRRPAGLDSAQAAICADAVSTPYGGIVRRAELRPGEYVGLWGIGGLGVHAVQISRLAGAALVVAVDPSPTARDRALAAGADHVIDPTAGDVIAEIQRITDGRGLDLAVDLVGANAVLAQATDCLGRYGRTLMVGLSLDQIQLGMGVFFGLQSQSLLGHLGYTKQDLDEVVGLAGIGRIDLSKSVSETMPLSEVAAGVEKLRSKEGNPVRLVVLP